MSPDEMKEIRQYLTDRQYLGKKWTGEVMAKALVRTSKSVSLYERGAQEIPEIVAERVLELMAECAILDLQEEIFSLILYKVARPSDLVELKEKLKGLTL
jgi:hypothetical protein